VAVVAPGSTHAFRNIGQHKARLQFIIVPGARSEEFFRQLANCCVMANQIWTYSTRSVHSMTPALSVRLLGAV